MRAVDVVRALGPIDARSVVRDPLLRWFVALPLALALLTRWVLPALVARASELLSFDLMPYYRPVLGIYFILLVPFLAGWVVGFLLLDQRDDRTLLALLVTPLSLNGFLAYRLAVPTALSVLLTVVVLPLAGLLQTGYAALLLAALTAAPVAPTASLCLACFAANKVQGFALMKASGVLVLPPLIAYFVDSGWQLAFGVVPTYWGPAVYWTAARGDPRAGLLALAGLAYQTLFFWLLLRRFNRSVRS